LMLPIWAIPEGIIVVFSWIAWLQDEEEKKGKGGLNRALAFFQRFINRQRDGYQRSLRKVLLFRRRVLFATSILFLLSLFIMMNLGYELFPQSDVGQMEISVRMESGTPLNIAEKTIASMEEVVRQETGNELDQIFSNIGVFYDLPAAYTPNSGTQDAFIGVQLKEDHRVSIFEYASRLREKLNRQFPGIEISFNTGGMITAALNEGKPSPIDVQIKGNDLNVLRNIAERIRDTIVSIPATRDVRILQRLDQPSKNINIDRIKAAELGGKTCGCY